MKRRSRKESLEEKVQQEIRKRVFDRSQRLEDQELRLDEQEAQLEALREVSELSQGEIESIARQVRREFASSQKERRRKISRMIRPAVILAVAIVSVGLFLWIRHLSTVSHSASPRDRGEEKVRLARSDEELALIKAAGRGNFQMVRFLLDKHVPVNIVADRDRTTPLMAAAAAGHFEVVELLLEHGADPLLRDAGGLAALDHAERSGHLPTKNLLARAVFRALK